MILWMHRLYILIIERSPFREEHLVVVPKKISVYMPTWRRCPTLSHPVHYSPPNRGQLVAIGAGLGQLVHMIHQCTQAYIWHLRQGVPLTSPIPSCPVPSHPVLYGPIGGCWCWPGTIGPHGPSMYTSIYMASQARCPTCPIPSCPILSHPIPSYLSNRLRYRLDPGLIGKVFESTFQILENGISMAISLATRCKTPVQQDANG